MMFVKHTSVVTTDISRLVARFFFAGDRKTFIIVIIIVHPETKGSNLSMLRKKCKQISETMYISDFLLIFAYMRVVTGSPFWTIPHRGGPESHQNCQIRAFQTT